MEEKKLAQQILNYVGGAENIESAAHCATRLRLVVKDQGIVDVDAIEKLEAVKGTFTTAGQFQIILGTGVVNRVFAEMVKIGNINQASTGEVTRTAMKHLNPFQRFARTLSNILVPIIPAIVASGLLMGLLGLLTNKDGIPFILSPGPALDPANPVVVLLNMFSNIAFIYLPILIAFSAGKEFGANPFLAAALGGFMVHPDLQNAWTVGTGIKSYLHVAGFAFPLVGYQGTVLPVLAAVWVMSYVEKGIRSVVPNILDILLTPFLTLAVTGFFTFFAIGPFMRGVGWYISIILQYAYFHFGPLAGLVFGGVYSAIVITGIHHSFHAIELEMIKNIGANYLLPIWSMANVAQGGAATAVFFKTTNMKIKSICLPAAVSCLLGITEAAIFGVNLRLSKPFIAAAIGGAVGGCYVVVMKVSMTAVGMTGFPGTLIVTSGFVAHYLIGMLLAFGAAFAGTFIIGFNDEEAEA